MSRTERHFRSIHQRLTASRSHVGPASAGPGLQRFWACRVRAASWYRLTRASSVSSSNGLKRNSTSDSVCVPSLNVVPAVRTTTDRRELRVLELGCPELPTRHVCHHQVEQDQKRFPATLERAERQPRIAERRDLIAARGHDQGQRFAQIVIVIDDVNSGSRVRRDHRGNSTANVDPWSTRLSTVDAAATRVHDLLRNPQAQSQSRMMPGGGGAREQARRSCAVRPQGSRRRGRGP